MPRTYALTPTRNSRFAVAICLLALVGVSLATLGQRSPAVNVEEGALEGSQLSFAPHAASFLGIPFAAPPVGDVRWKPPQPPAHWTGVRPATTLAPACLQTRAGFPISEDCLYLNVWTPNLSAKPGLPVMMWIHGGGNENGRAEDTPFERVLPLMGVVFVSIHYRLGPFGFLAHPALTAESPHGSSGNYGILDQIAALKWVNRNISNFGGDPNQVTVIGESAGAGDACLLMASPLAAGLFQRAVLESGDCQSIVNSDLKVPIAFNSISGSAEGNGVNLAKGLGIPDGPDTLRHMRGAAAGKVLEEWDRDPHVHVAPDVDGWVIPEQPIEIFAHGKQAHIPVIVGSNADEGTMFVGPSGPKTVTQYKAGLETDTGKYAAEEFVAYPVASDAEVHSAQVRLQTDYMGYGAYTFARSMTRAGERAYLYYFTYPATGTLAALGAFHGEELMVLTESYWKGWASSPDDATLGAIMRNYWVQFAKTGEPNIQGQPRWDAFDPKKNQSLELGHTVAPMKVLHTEGFAALDHIMAEIVSDVVAGGAKEAPGKQ
jgi:para-nitrobenzyl esterase